MRIPGVIKLVLLALLLQLGLRVPVAYGQGRTPTAAVVVKRMLERYQTITSYEDRGTVRVVRQEPSVAAHSRGRMTSVQDQFAVDFKTWYVRPHSFRFDWRRPAKEQRESSIWGDGANFYSWMPSAGPSDGSFTLAKRGSLNVSIDDSRRSSMGANYFIPTLLMKDAGYVSFADAVSSMKRMSIVGEERVDGELCFRVKGLIMDETFVLWIGKKSNLLRRIRTVYAAARSFEGAKPRISEQVLAEETHYDIKINQRIDRNVFSARPVIRAGDLDLTVSTPSGVELEGRLIVQTKYGPPNFGENPKTDKRVKVPIVVLTKAISVRGTSGAVHNATSVESARRIQLVFTDSATNYKSLVGKDIVVKGTLFHAETGGHYTDVLISVQSIEPKRRGAAVRSGQ